MFVPRGSRTLIQIMFSSSCFHSRLNFEHIVRKKTLPLQPFHLGHIQSVKCELIYLRFKNKIKVFPLGLFSIRNSNLRIFKVNGNATVHYLSAAVSRAAAAVPLPPPLSSHGLFFLSPFSFFHARVQNASLL